MQGPPSQPHSERSTFAPRYDPARAIGLTLMGKGGRTCSSVHMSAVADTKSNPASRNLPCAKAAIPLCTATVPDMAGGHSYTQKKMVELCSFDWFLGRTDRQCWRWHMPSPCVHLARAEDHSFFQESKLGLLQTLQQTTPALTVPKASARFRYVLTCTHCSSSMACSMTLHHKTGIRATREPHWALAYAAGRLVLVSFYVQDKPVEKQPRRRLAHLRHVCSACIVLWEQSRVRINTLRASFAAPCSA